MASERSACLFFFWERNERMKTYNALLSAFMYNIHNLPDDCVSEQRYEVIRTDFRNHLFEFPERLSVEKLLQNGIIWPNVLTPFLITRCFLYESIAVELVSQTSGKAHVREFGLVFLCQLCIFCNYSNFQ